MIGAVGIWILIVGYALVYTGASYFTGSGTAPSLAQSLGLQALTVTPSQPPTSNAAGSLG